MKKIILHDYFEVPDGGGKLSLITAKHLNIDLGYGFMTPCYRNYFDLCNNKQIDLNCFSRILLWKQLKLSRAFQMKTNFLGNYDRILYSGTYAPLAVKQTYLYNIYYCHTPPRFIYDQYDFYLSILSDWQKPLFKAFVQYLKPQYENSVAMMDRILTNSENTKKRIYKYLGKQATVIYPPCDSKGLIWAKPNNYYLSTARLDPLKRVDLIVKAFIKMPKKKLIVASGGSELNKLRRLSKNSSNIQFTGWVKQHQLVELINNSIATIYLPINEDFGISSVESMIAGKPVIGVAEGGLLETIIDNETGILLPTHFTLNDIVDSISRMSSNRATMMRTDCARRGRLFETEQFIRSMKNIF